MHKRLVGTRIVVIELVCLSLKEVNLSIRREGSCHVLWGYRIVCQLDLGKGIILCGDDVPGIGPGPGSKSHCS